MQRICGTLADQSFDVLLVGRKKKGSVPLQEKGFRQKRLGCFFNRGFVFYAEYNLRLFFFLLFTRCDIICAIDLDTILPVYFTSVIRKKKRVYDAHELFTEQKEIITRPAVHRFWSAIEKFAVPKFIHGYTVNDFLVKEFNKRYGVNYTQIRNLPVMTPLIHSNTPTEKNIIYQGAVNEGRCFETLIPAMKDVNAVLDIFGTGNFFSQAKQLAQQHALEHKVRFHGDILPAELVTRTQQAYIGITLFEADGMNQYYSLSNRFFDYIMAGKPQVCVDYPLYAAIQAEYGVAYLIDNTQAPAIANALNKLLENDGLYTGLQQNCLKAREELNWEQEKEKLARLYREWSIVNEV